MQAISFRFVLGAMFVLAVAGCGKQKPGTVPVKSPVQKFVAPEEDEVFPEVESDGGSMEDVDGE
jgi:hypothetical protein